MCTQAQLNRLEEEGTHVDGQVSELSGAMQPAAGADSKGAAGSRHGTAGVGGGSKALMGLIRNIAHLEEQVRGYCLKKALTTDTSLSTLHVASG